MENSNRFLKTKNCVGGAMRLWRLLVCILHVEEEGRIVALKVHFTFQAVCVQF